MNKYQSYKPSSVEWVGDIPNSWEETRLKYIGNLYGGLTGKSGEDFKQDDNPNNKPYIPYTNIFRNTYISKNHVDYVVLKDGENQNKVQKFDLFFLMSSETYQDLGKPCILIEDIEELYLNSFCKGFRVNRIDVNPLFLNYQLLGSIHKELISIEGRGFTRINLRQDRLNETPIFLPPLQEQLQIVQFLDEKTELIDKLISTKERKITLLKEQRTSLINKVVTKGLNPNVKMKDCGVEWIGEIPEEWKKGRLKHFLFTKPDNGLFKKKDDFGSGVRFVNVSDLFNQNNKIDIEKLDRVDVSSDELKKSRLTNGDIFFVRSSLKLEGIGVSSIIENIEEDIVFDCHIIRIKPDRVKILPKYLITLLNSFSYRNYLVSVSESVTMTTISQDKIKDIVFHLPPLTEQNQIVEYLDYKTKEIDDMVQLEQKKIDLLKEYRKSLISEVVTGKIKVTN